MLRSILSVLPAGASLAFVRPAPAPPPGPSSLLALAAIEAADFLDEGEAPPAEVDRFGLLALSLDAAVERGRNDLAGIAAIEAIPRAHGRSHGLEWAYEQQFVDADRLRQAAALLRALAPHEAAIRALLSADGAAS